MSRTKQDTTAAKYRNLVIQGHHLKAFMLKLKLHIRRREYVRRDALERGCQRLGLRMRDGALAAPLPVLAAAASRYNVQQAQLAAAVQTILREELNALADRDEALPVKLGR